MLHHNQNPEFYDEVRTDFQSEHGGWGGGRSTWPRFREIRISREPLLTLILTLMLVQRACVYLSVLQLLLLS